MALARRKTRPIASNRHLLVGRRVQSRATGTCSKEDASNREQLALARRKTRPITSNWHLPDVCTTESRSTGDWPTATPAKHKARATSDRCSDAADVPGDALGLDRAVVQGFRF